MKKDTEVSPHGLLLDNQTPVSPDRVCLSLSLVNVTLLKGFQEKHVGTCVTLSSIEIITLSLCNIWKTNDYVMHIIIMSFTYVFIYLFAQSVRSGEDGLREEADQRPESEWHFSTGLQSSARRIISVNTAKWHASSEIHVLHVKTPTWLHN